jgi:hypothetical protein
VFERYTERARRAIFFARYEASNLGSGYIETEHLLLGLLREHKLLGELPHGADEAIRKEIEKWTPKVTSPTSTSVDLPLSVESKLALPYASQESKALQHEVIDAGHLVLGLLRVEGCFAAALLRQHGIDLTTYRDFVRTSLSKAGEEKRLGSRRDRSVERPAPWNQPETGNRGPIAPAIARLAELLEKTIKNIDAYSDRYGEQRLKRKPWSRKEALGHLVDWGFTYQQWLARALTEPKLIVAEYPQDAWVSAQNYGTFSWPDLVDLWVCLNRLIVHVLAQIPQDKMNMQCRVGIEQPTALSQLVDRYIAQSEDIIGQILAHI